MTIVKYLIDTNALSRIGRKSRESTFVRDNCKIPSEVLHEAVRESGEENEAARRREHADVAKVPLDRWPC